MVIIFIISSECFICFIFTSRPINPHVCGCREQVYTTLCLSQYGRENLVPLRVAKSLNLNRCGRRQLLTFVGTLPLSDSYLYFYKTCCSHDTMSSALIIFLSLLLLFYSLYLILLCTSILFRKWKLFFISYY